MAKQGFTDIALETKPFRQSKSLCGPAALKIVARYFGVNLSETRLATLCRSSGVSGTTGESLAAAAKKVGFAVRIVDGGNLRMIASWLRKGVPVIVDWMSIGYRGAARVAAGHYSVVSSLTATEIILEDPAIGRKRRLPRELFLQLWYDFKYLSPRKSEDVVMRRMIVVAPQAMFERSGLKRRMPQVSQKRAGKTAAALAHRQRPTEGKLYTPERHTGRSSTFDAS